MLPCNHDGLVCTLPMTQHRDFGNRNHHISNGSLGKTNGADQAIPVEYINVSHLFGIFQYHPHLFTCDEETAVRWFNSNQACRNSRHTGKDKHQRVKQQRKKPQWKNDDWGQRVCFLLVHTLRNNLAKHKKQGREDEEGQQVPVCTKQLYHQQCRKGSQCHDRYIGSNQCCTENDLGTLEHLHIQLRPLMAQAGKMFHFELVSIHQGYFGTREKPLQ